MRMNDDPSITPASKLVPLRAGARQPADRFAEQQEEREPPFTQFVHLRHHVKLTSDAGSVVTRSGSQDITVVFTHHSSAHAPEATPGPQPEQTLEQRMASDRARLLAARYSKSSTPEDDARESMLTKRLETLIPAVSAQEWQALEESEARTAARAAYLADLTARYGKR